MNVLLAGLGGQRDWALRSLRDAGHHVGVLDSPHRIPVDWCDWWAPADVLDIGSLARACGSRRDWDAVLCWEELAIDVAHDFAVALGARSPEMPRRVFRDKAAMHDRLVAAGFPSPHLGVVSDLAECRALTAGRLPVVLKPADFGGSVGVRVVGHEDDLDDAFAIAARVSLSRRVVVHRYVDGPEVSVEAVTWAPGATEILAVTAKTTTPPPACVELVHRVPAALDADTEARIAQVVTTTLDALGMTAGVSHTELKLTADGPVVIETAGRPAGDHIPRLVHLVTGWNVYLAELAAATGTAVKPDPPAVDCAAVRFFTGRAGEPMRRPRDLVDRTSSGVLQRTLRDIRYTLSDGAIVRELSSNIDRCGYAVVAGSGPDVEWALAELDHLKPVA